MMADKDMLDGKQRWASMVDWKSWKLRRVTRSSLAGEVQAFSDCQDTQEWLRVFWQELWSPEGIVLKKSDDCLLNDHLSTILTDCKSLYDALAKVETAVGMCVLLPLAHLESSCQAGYVQIYNYFSTSSSFSLSDIMF